MHILFVGGTGEISQACVAEAIRAGHRVTMFNRGLRETMLPEGVESITGDFANDESYSVFNKRHYDVVCQFLAFDIKDIERDIALFSGHCAQYIFISTASAYEKPTFQQAPRSHIITEETPLANPFWAYSRSKAACETRLMEAHNEGRLPVSIVRPSHTYRTRLPSTIIDGDHLAWRLLNDKAVLVHGDGESLWTLTHAADFARAFVGLCGLNTALGEAIHITSSEAYTWNNLLHSVAKILGKVPEVVPVLSKTLVAYEPRLEGTLLGDKSNTVMFDNSKIERLSGGWRCQVPLEEGLKDAWRLTEKRLQSGYQPNPTFDTLIDRIVAEQH